jgi:hypothetical protein
MIHRFPAGFFDGNKQPVQASGIISGGSVMLESLIGTVSRVVI